MSGAVSVLAQGLIRVSAMAVETFLPGRCFRCGAVVDGAGALCPPCWESMTFITAPHCDRCGQPFEVDPAGGFLCGQCMADPPPYTRARAVFRYDDASRILILRFKHGDRTAAAPQFARWMARAGSELLAEAQVVVPVPLHRWRLWRRRYNQAALLAQALGKQANIRCVPDVLGRIRATPSQGKLGRGQRRRNVQGAFRLRREAAVRGKRVLLIDDVLTSGATVGECVRVLLRGGAERVEVLTLARVVLSQGFESGIDSLYS